MSEKCRKYPLSKNKDTKALSHFEENDYKKDEMHTDRHKTDWSVQHL